MSPLDERKTRIYNLLQNLFFQQWFKLENKIFFLLSFCYQMKKKCTSMRLTLSLACCPMERPTCFFLAQDFYFLHNWINELENEKYLIKIKKFRI